MNPRWKILLFILSITIINYFDRSALSYAIVPLEEEFGLTSSDFGLIAGAFGMGYLLTTFFAGFLIDKFGVVRMWGISAILWSLVTILTGISTGFYTLFIFRFLLGIFEAIHFPALLHAINDWLEHKGIARNVSFVLLGVPLASLIGAPFLSFLTAEFGWSVMFFTLGALGLIWVIFWFLNFKSPPLDQHFKLKSKIEQIPWKERLFTRLFIGNCLNFFILGYIVFFALTWFPGYLQENFHISLKKTGALLTFPWAMSALFLLLGGWISDYLYKKTGSTRKSRVLVIGISMLLASITFFCLLIFSSLMGNIILLSIGYGWVLFTNAPVYSLNADLFKANVGKAQGIMTTFFALSGILSPIFTGFLHTLTGNFQSAIHLVILLCFLAFLNALFFQKEPKNLP